MYTEEHVATHRRAHSNRLIRHHRCLRDRQQLRVVRRLHQCFGSMGHRPHIRQCRPSLPWLHAVHARMRERVCVCIAHVWRASVCVCVCACMSCRALLRCRGSAHVCYKGFWMCGVYLALQSMTLPVDFAIKLVDENPTSLLSRDRFIAGLFY